MGDESQTTLREPQGAQMIDYGQRTTDDRRRAASDPLRTPGSAENKPQTIHDMWRLRRVLRLSKGRRSYVLKMSLWFAFTVRFGRFSSPFPPTKKESADYTVWTNNIDQFRFYLIVLFACNHGIIPK